MIKHDATYESEEDYEERIRHAEQGGQAGEAGSL
jgi:hypothetical protein